MEKLKMKNAKGSLMKTVVLGSAIFCMLGIPNPAMPCTDGQSGTVVTSSEAVRIGMVGGVPTTRSIETCYSDGYGNYYLEDHRLDSTLYAYDGSGYTDPGFAANWYSSCTEPLCYTVSQASNIWTSPPGFPASTASDFRNLRKVLDLFRNVYGRNGADNSGENLMIISGVNYDGATAMGALRVITVGKERYDLGMPTWGVLGVLAHKFGHIPESVMHLRSKV